MLTIVKVETTGRELPLYLVVDRMAWTGAKHTSLHAQLVDLARNVWGLSVLVVDATGVGAGLAAFLADSLGRVPKKVVVEPFVFTGASKSRLGWDFIGLIDGGRIKEYADDGEAITRVYRHQLAACAYEVELPPFGGHSIIGHDAHEEVFPCPAADRPIPLSSKPRRCVSSAAATAP